ncbi:FAD-dependent oxidoreductase [Acidiphilium sp.]|uniref:FAD-dependent oxidoreductase n=1 Tax=Acidiphilium sp. TaxID=527 RepID=UPI003D003075
MSVQTECPAGNLANRETLVGFDREFVERLQSEAPALHRSLMVARAMPDRITRQDEAELVMALAPHLEAMIGTLFGIETELAAVRAATAARTPVHSVKRNFVQRQAVKAYADPSAFDGAGLRGRLQDRGVSPFTEDRFAQAVLEWEAAADVEMLDIAKRYAAWATLTADGQDFHASDVLFRVPHRIDPMHLVPVETIERDGVTMQRLPESHWRARDGFALTDTGMTTDQALDQMNYCIWCHGQGKDSCSQGLKDHKTGTFRSSPFGVSLAGCPLEERISEMHQLRVEGLLLGAFATIVIDNPMVAATGHRICNDCMKACIYQKQEPVDIPQAESSILRDVLALPWGFEIYALLTRWNPLDIRRPIEKSDTGRSALVVGLGPAGFTLAHHLLNEGHRVVAVDGLKLEPLPFDVTTPIRDVEILFESLDDRVMAGFGGVAEYGITVRWNKNYLKLIRILLERRQRFAAIGGVRFGGDATVSIDDAWAMGFDHIALSMGAGRPTVLDIPNGLARGVRQASDFLMALQLTGAAKPSSIANLQLRLPVVVIGGGLTAIDTATESLAYYVRQVEKFASRYRILVAERGEARVRAGWSAEDVVIANEFLAHAEALAEERTTAEREGRLPQFVPMLEAWGGATIAYRRRLIDAPSYTLNHEEVAKAMEEGVRFAEGLTPVAVEIDTVGHVAGLRLRGAEGEVVLPARAILVAAGTQPNTVLAREDGRIKLDGRYFQAIDVNGNPVIPERASAKPPEIHVLMHRAPDGRMISFFGDLHPSFFGNVVKAMGSAKRGYPIVSALMNARTPSTNADLLSRARSDLQATVRAVNRLTATIVEVVVHAPAAARAFRPGQFFRLQNFETTARHLDEPAGRTVLAMEGLAMTGAGADPETGLISVIALEMGGSSDLCAHLRPGEPVVLMGPTGMPTEILPNATVALVGGGLGNAVLFSIGAALRAAGSRVLYFAGYKKLSDRYRVEDIERAADVIVWCCDETPGFAPNRPQDRSFVGNIVQAMLAYASGDLGDAEVPLGECHHIIAIGSDRMMQAVGAARHGVLRPYLASHHSAIGSINSPMQCMMKEVCAQCLQLHVDPVTGSRHVVFSCFNQDQALDEVDFSVLADRLGQNRLAEKLTAQWIDRALHRLEVRTALAAE